MGNNSQSCWVIACIKDKLSFCKAEWIAQQDTDLTQGKEEVWHPKMGVRRPSIIWFNYYICVFDVKL